MVVQRSLLLAAASAFTISNVVAHPHGGAHHVHRAHQLKRQEELQLSYVTLYQTQPAGPNGTDIVYTITSPLWVTGGAAGTATGTGFVPVITSSATPVAAPMPANPTAPAVTAPSSSVVAQPSVIPDALPSIPDADEANIAPEPEAPSATIAPEPEAPAVTIASKTSEVAPAPEPTIPSNPQPSSGSGAASGEYKEYSGIPSEYPAESEWLSFEALFEASKGDASKGMAAHKVTEDQMSSLASGVKAAAASTGVDARIIFAMVMQESHGDATVSSGGLIQATSSDGQLCNGSWSDVENQLTCGLNGVYAACAAKFPENDPWVALRCYNSGPTSTEGTTANLNTIAGYGTPSYVNDIANRLVNGWTN